MTTPDPERERMRARDAGEAAWSQWGSYVSDRQWGTVREDYSADGSAWDYFTHDMARSRAYRWGEDGLAGISDDDGQLCFAPSFWNGKDPILKERPFGLANSQGNHGEDVKDYFYHIDNTPTHSLMRQLYKYPQGEFPYEDLIRVNGSRSKLEPEYELVDTGIFKESRYFDIFVEYAKAAPDDICIKITAANRGPDAAPLTILPTLWFRNTWSWEHGSPKPSLEAESDFAIIARRDGAPIYRLYSEGPHVLAFTENETNTERLYGSPNATPYVKDAFHEYVIQGKTEAVNPARNGTKAAAIYTNPAIASGETWTIRLRLTASPTDAPFGPSFEKTFEDRQTEADNFYQSLCPDLEGDLLMIKRRALAGLLWNKKFYYYAVSRWLVGDPAMPPPPKARLHGRNAFWQELCARDVISMPDSWEYPYFCAWDLMFHSVAFAVPDAATAKRQSLMLMGPEYVSPSAQVPAYEWALSDANPPIAGWAAWRIYSIERGKAPLGDIGYLRKAFHKLLMGYAWWCNRVDKTGDNVFEGGFLGLDNIGVFDRRYPLPDGSTIEQSDGTSWMAMFCLNMLNIAMELTSADASYVDIADKFLTDFIHLAAALNSRGPSGYTLWDDEDGFYYDVLKRPDGTTDYLKTRSLAGLTPIFAVESFDLKKVGSFPLLRKRYAWFQENFPHMLDDLHHIGVPGPNGSHLISLVPPDRLRRILTRVLDESEFLSPHGIRSLSRYYLDHPYTFTEGGETETLGYSPADSPVGMFGGNSNWRGPVWMPLNYLLIESLQKFGYYFGDTFQVEFPTGSGNELNLWEVSLALEQRLVSLFGRNESGARPFNGSVEMFNTDPHWRDLIQFNEYFNGDNGAGVGASHQTGWTALAAKMIHQLHTFEPDHH